ncbi:MAG: hypothetical protein ROZ36_07965 [Thermincola sp.]|nr:hypothetical protein [Thermincola sp.]
MNRKPCRIPWGQSSSPVIITGIESIPSGENGKRKTRKPDRGKLAGGVPAIDPQKELYQDKFIILSDGPYSAVPAESLGLSEEEWRRLSLIIRREHECTHYFTRRLFSAMRNNLLDELIADYMGIVSAVGSFRADWFLRFVGLEHYPQYRTGARLENYRGDPPLSDGAFKILWTLVKLAAERLEAYDSRWQGSHGHRNNKFRHWWGCRV